MSKLQNLSTSRHHRRNNRPRCNDTCTSRFVKSTVCTTAVARSEVHEARESWPIIKEIGFSGSWKEFQLQCMQMLRTLLTTPLTSPAQTLCSLGAFVPVDSWGLPSMGAEEEAQQTPAVDDAAVAETAASEHAAPRKGPMKRYQKPDIQELKAQINSLEATISQQKQRQQAIRSELDGRKRRSNDLESQGIRNQLQELRTQFQQVLVRPWSALAFMPTRVCTDHDFVAHACPVSGAPCFPAEAPDHIQVASATCCVAPWGLCCVHALGCCCCGGSTIGPFDTITTKGFPEPDSLPLCNSMPLCADRRRRSRRCAPS